MSNTTNPELCSLKTNVCKPPKNFDFSEIVQPFRFVWFEECPWVCYTRWEDKTYCLPCALYIYYIYMYVYNVYIYIYLIYIIQFCIKNVINTNCFSIDDPFLLN